MKINGIMIDPADHVVTLSSAVKAGDAVSYLKGGKVCSQTAAEEIPQYHKMAVTSIEKGQKVMKYGAWIGEATKEIAAGSWVHTHNLQSAGMIQKKADEAKAVHTEHMETKKEGL